MTRVLNAGSSVRIAVDPPSVTVGPTTTLPPGSSAIVANVGTDTHLVLAFGIPRGASGGGGSGGSSDWSEITGKPTTLAGYGITDAPRGITSVAINGAGHLIVTYTDGTIQDAGLVGGGTPTPSPSYLMDFRVPANARYAGAML